MPHAGSLIFFFFFTEVRSCSASSLSARGGVPGVHRLCSVVNSSYCSHSWGTRSSAVHRERNWEQTDRHKGREGGRKGRVAGPTQQRNAGRTFRAGCKLQKAKNERRGNESRTDFINNRSAALRTKRRQPQPEGGKRQRRRLRLDPISAC